MPTTLPARIGPYPIRQLIGSGSMGHVYLGHDPMIDRPVAVKTIARRADDGDAERTRAAARFRVEAQAAGRLNHPGIVAIYQFGEDLGCSYIAMEYVAGHSLREHLTRGPRFSAEEVLCVMFQLLDAMQFAHDHGVIHRDIKPANLIVARDGRLKITDFGIARMESSPATRDDTRAHVAIGTPGYMAPEQYTGGEIDRRTDLFSAGVVLYQLLSGSAPFSGTEESVMYQIVYGDTPRLPPLGDDAPLAGFDAVIARALAKQPADRYADARALRQALAALARAPVPEVLRRAVEAEAQAACAAASPAGPAGLVDLIDKGSGPPPEDARPTGSGTGGQPSTSPPTGWDEAILGGLERELAVHVGPVARVLVRRGARGHSTLVALRRSVASAIADPVARERFLLTGTTHAPGTAGSGARGGFVDTRPPGSTAQAQAVQSTAGLQADDLARVGAVLSRELGPISKILVRRCAAQASSREQLVSLLLAQLGPTADRRAIEIRLWQALP